MLQRHPIVVDFIPQARRQSVIRGKVGFLQAELGSHVRVHVEHQPAALCHPFAASTRTPAGLALLLVVLGLQESVVVVGESDIDISCIVIFI